MNLWKLSVGRAVLWPLFGIELPVNDAHDSSYKNCNKSDVNDDPTNHSSFWPLHAVANAVQESSQQDNKPTDHRKFRHIDRANAQHDNYSDMGFQKVALNSLPRVVLIPLLV